MEAVHTLTWLQLAVYGLACFRLAVLLSEDSGPWNVFLRLRSSLKREAKKNTPLRQSKLHEGIQCVRCDSLWIAAPIAIYALSRDTAAPWLVAGTDVILLWNALSALAILWNRAFPKR